MAFVCHIQSSSSSSPRIQERFILDHQYNLACIQLTYAGCHLVTDNFADIQGIDVWGSCDVELFTETTILL
jgi:hypothetical protein